MRNAAILLLCTSLFTCLPASGQKAALFGGYQLSRLDGGVNLNGWNTSLTGGVAPFLGITGDFSGVYKSGSKLHTFTVGPEVWAHVGRWRPFAHALFGGYTSSGPTSNGATQGFVMYYGGGLDVKAAPFVHIRPGQFDWMIAHSNSVTDKNNFRYSAGLVFTFSRNGSY
jgi:hypothetical protein